MFRTTSTTRPTHKRLLALSGLLGAALLLSGCVDTDPPEWWEFEGERPEGTTLTAVRDGQICTDIEEEPAPNSLRLHFIDVAQGDAIWVQTPTGENILIDAGDGGSATGRSDAAPIIEGYMTDMGFPFGSTLDAALISHAHSDHYGGFLTLLTRYFFRQFIDPGLESSTQGYRTLLDLAENRHADPSLDFTLIRPALAPDNGFATQIGDQIDLFGPQVDAWVLNAGQYVREGEDSGSQINNTSIVLRLTYQGRNILLTGDAEVEIEREILARFLQNEGGPGLDTHILKVAHHGSSTSSTILEALFRDIPFEDRFAVIQSGRQSFGGVQLPTEDTVFNLWSYMPQENLFSTEADDSNKTDSQAGGDDHVMAVVNPDGSMYVCYRQ